MILELIFIVLTELVGLFGRFLPGGNEIPIKLPWGTDDLLVQGVTGYKILSTAFPPFEVVLQAFLVYILFRIVLRILKAVPLLGRTLEQN